MRSIPQRILVCLMLGAVTTLAVAWGIAWFVTPRETAEYGDISGPFRSQRVRGQWMVEVDTVPGAALVDSEIFDGTYEEAPGPSPEDVAPKWLWLRPGSKRFGSVNSECVYATGWPFVALGCEGYLNYQKAQFKGAAWDIMLSPVRRRDPLSLAPLTCDRALPFRPLVPNFTLDTAIYTFAWMALLFFLPRGWHFGRSWSRRRRGRCVSCGYDLRGNLSGCCPECGAIPTDKQNSTLAES